MMGINVNRTISFTFFARRAPRRRGRAALRALRDERPLLRGFRLGLLAFTAAVLGGIGNLAGAVLGALVIGMIESFSDGFQHSTRAATGRESIIFARAHRDPRPAARGPARRADARGRMIDAAPPRSGEWPARVRARRWSRAHAPGARAGWGAGGIPALPVTLRSGGRPRARRASALVPVQTPRRSPIAVCDRARALPHRRRSRAPAADLPLAVLALALLYPYYLDALFACRCSLFGAGSRASTSPFVDARLHDDGARPEHRRRLRGPPRPRLRRVLRDRRLHRRLARVAASSHATGLPLRRVGRPARASAGIHISIWIVLIVAGLPDRARSA